MSPIPRKFYQEDGSLTLDVGPYAAALEYACGATAQVIGKPNPNYFLSALKSLNLEPSEVAMIGDDVESDVGGAQAVGLAGILVRTGKYRPANESHPSVKPDAVVDNLAAAVKLFLDE
jgi:phospholysine phosphohistidine inorganic pyrophosphate phosphatase